MTLQELIAAIELSGVDKSTPISKIENMDFPDGVVFEVDEDTPHFALDPRQYVTIRGE